MTPSGCRGDHSAGIAAVMAASGPKRIIAHPDALGQKYGARREGPPEYAGFPYVREYIEGARGEVFEFHDSFHELAPGLFMTGEVERTNDFEKVPDEMLLRLENGDFAPDSFTDDNSLVLDTPRGLVFLFGCAHRGIANIMEYGCARLGKKVYGFIGGTHLKAASDEQFARTVAYLRGKGLGFMAPAHCTGIDRPFELRTLFPDIFISSYCGKACVF